MDFEKLGYQFKNELLGDVPPENDPYADKPDFEITAWKGGENVGSLRSVGGVTYRGEAWVNVNVNPEHRGKGVGSRMFEIAEESNPSYTFVHDNLTRAGFGLVSSRKKLNPSRHDVRVDSPPPRGCTGHATFEGGLQHDAGPCPIHGT